MSNRANEIHDMASQVYKLSNAEIAEKILNMADEIADLRQQLAEKGKEIARLEEIVKLDAGTIKLNNTEIVRLNKSLTEWALWKDTI